ncbi:MAG TPA: TonB-dependent receptor [Anaeromyxobacteraceae bacterium]|nr:TonB-dependent receptor [Anaeromyxobacteraceae bacterium]
MITLRSLLGVSLALALGSRAKGEDLSDLAGLLNEPVVSTASKSAEAANLAPATTSIITSEDLRRYGITSLADAINFLSVGMLTEPSYATPEIGARGVLLTGDYGNHVLLLLDGHVVNEPWDGTAYYDISAAIPLDLVDHVEVILGPGSVLYGSNAMLGVINVITKRAKDYAGLHLIAEGGLPEVGHFALGYGQAFEWLGQSGELTAALDYVGTRGPSETYPVETYGGDLWGGTATHRAIDVPASYLRFILGDLELSLRAAQSRRAATQIMGDFDDPNNWERDRWLSFDARYSASLSANLRLAVRLYGDYYDYLDNAPSASSLDCEGNQSSCVFRNSGVSRWVGTEVNGTYDWLKDGRYVTLVGADVRYEHVTSYVAYDDSAEGLSMTGASYDKEDTVIGAYLQQTLHPASFLSLNAGVRLDHDPDFGSHLSPRVAAVVPAWPGGTVKGIYSTAFRAPSFYERYYSDATSELAAPNLKPETVQSVEGVVEQKVGADRLRLAVFRSWWDDLVVTVPASDAQVASAIASGQLSPGVTGIVEYANASSVDSYGLNADFEGSALLQKLRYGAGLTLARSRAEGDVPLAAAAQVFGNARISYDLGGALPILALAGRVAGSRPVSGTNFAPVPEADPQVEVRGTVSGPIAGGLAYRLSADWASNGTSAYAVGPLRAPQPPNFTSQTMLLLPRYQVLFGLRYDR